MNNDLRSIYELLAEVKNLRSRIELRERIEADGRPFLITKSLADHQDGYVTEAVGGVITEHVQRETQDLKEQLRVVEGVVAKMRELL